MWQYSIFRWLTSKWKRYLIYCKDTTRQSVFHSSWDNSHYVTNIIIDEDFMCTMLYSLTLSAFNQEKFNQNACTLHWFLSNWDFQWFYTLSLSSDSHPRRSIYSWVMKVLSNHLQVSSIMVLIETDDHLTFMRSDLLNKSIEVKNNSLQLTPK